MGWTSGKLTEPYSAEACLRFEFGDDFMERVQASARKGKVIYAAVRDVGDTCTFGLVLLADSVGGVLYTKPITEDMGPAEDRCPLRILVLLTETSNQNALEWRQRCLRNALRGVPKPGETIKTAKSIVFTNGAKADTFRRMGGTGFRGRGLWETPEGMVVALPSLNTLEWERVES